VKSTWRGLQRQTSGSKPELGVSHLACKGLTGMESFGDALFPLLPPNHDKFSINFLGRVADLDGFLT